MGKGYKELLLSASFAVLLTGCVAGQQNSQNYVVSEEEAKGGFLAADQMVKTDVSQGEAFKGANKVIVGSFKVGFVESKRASVQAGGGLTGSAYGGKSTALMNMEGLSNDTMQQVTEAAYTQFLSQLEAQGYTIESVDKLYQYPKFEKVKRYPMPFTADNSGLLSDYGVTHYFTPRALGNKVPLFMNEIPGETGGFGFSSPNAATAEFALATGIRVLNVVYTIDFAYTDSYGGWHTNSSKITANQAMTVVPGATVGIIGGWGSTFNSATGNVRTEVGVVAENAEVGDFADSTTELNKGVQMATNVFGLLVGTGSNISRNYTLSVDEEKYQQEATKLAARVNNNLVNRMVQLR